MFTYIVVFLTTLLFFYASEKSRSKVIENITSILSILIISIFAGIRDNTVGTDVGVYGERFYDYAVNSPNFGQLKQILTTTGETNDMLFHIINYSLSRFSSNYHVGLFFYELITVSVVYIAFRRIKTRYNISITLGMFFFLFTMFNPSLNLMKQIMAVSITFLAMTFLINHEYKWYFAFILVAFFIHGSALIGIPIYIVFKIFEDRKIGNSSNKLLAFLVFAVLTVVAMYFVSGVVGWLVLKGIVRTNYLNYLSGGTYSLNSSINFFSLILPCFSIMHLSVLYNKATREIVDNSFWISITILSTITSFATLISNYLGRISYYFVLPMLLYQMILLSIEHKMNRNVIRCVLIVIVGVVWIHDIAIKNFNNTIPYVIGYF